MDLDWDENNGFFEKVPPRLAPPPPSHWGPGANCPCCPLPLSAALSWVVAKLSSPTTLTLKNSDDKSSNFTIAGQIVLEVHVTLMISDFMLL